MVSECVCLCVMCVCMCGVFGDCVCMLCIYVFGVLLCGEWVVIMCFCRHNFLCVVVAFNFALTSILTLEHRMTPGAGRNICNFLIFMSWIFLHFNWDLNVCASLWLFLPIYCATNHFQGIIWLHRWHCNRTCDMLKHVGDILTYIVCVFRYI